MDVQTAILAVGTAEKALAAVQAELDEARNRLGSVRAEVAASEREVERLADRLCEGGAAQLRKPLAAARELLSTQEDIAAGHERRAAAAEERHVAALRALEAARQAQAEAELAEIAAEMAREVAGIEATILGLAQAHVRFCRLGAAYVERAGRGNDWLSRLLIADPGALGRATAELVRRAMSEEGQEPIGAKWTDPTPLAAQLQRALDNWRPRPPAPMAPGAPRPQPAPLPAAA